MYYLCWYFFILSLVFLQDYTWTEPHSFFVLMGGIMLYVDGKPYLTLRPDYILRNKPLNVKCPHLVHWKSTESKLEDHIDGIHTGDELSPLGILGPIVELIGLSKIPTSPFDFQRLMAASISNTRAPYFLNLLHYLW
ncbi:hypothetical protein BDR07DRAFT_1459001 [Suillus spraguei]|nr:hypothetical protein BDR07DRAFT_1459001 [Suillus spraguei]